MCIRDRFYTTIIAEYTALKNEQTQRIVLRDTCLYISVSANTAIAAVYTQQQQSINILLFIPLASTLLFWIYATNELKVTHIRKYIQSHIIPCFSELDEKYKANLLGWEYLRRKQTFGRLVSKLCRLLVVWSSFSGASIVALYTTAPAAPEMMSGQHWPWLVGALFASLPYIFGLWLIDL